MSNFYGNDGAFNFGRNADTNMVSDEYGNPMASNQGFNPNNGNPMYNQDYTNAGFNHNNAFTNVMNNPVNNIESKKSKKKKHKKKKKHRFLKFLLFVILTVTLYLGVDYICDKIAYNTLTSVALDYPFEFTDDTNAIWYITDNFKIPTYYEKENGKKINVEWISDDESTVQFNGETAEVTRPSKSSKKVNIHQTYKFLIGKASIDYELNIIPTNTLNIDSVDVITLEELKNNEYNRDMQAVIGEDGQLKYMLGDFKNTYVYSIEDAYAVLQAYKKQFNASENVEFRFDKVNEIDIYRAYQFNCYINDTLIMDKYANITVDSETSQVTNISINATIDDITITTDESLDYNNIIDEYIKQNTDIESEYVLTEYNTIILEGKQLKTYYCIFKTGEMYRVYVNMKTGNIEYFKDESTYINEKKAEGVECFSNDTFGNTFTFDASKYNKKYYLYDVNRDIHAFDNEGYWDFVNAWNGHAQENGEDWLYWLGSPIALAQGTTGNILNFEITSKNKEFKEWAYTKSYSNLQTAYDWYRSKGLTSYDGKGSPITVLVGHTQSRDNACWENNLKLFKVGTVDYFKYPLGISPEIMVHEYTHAVFNNKLNSNVSVNGLSDSTGKELDGINEAYADVLGIVATNNTSWIIGDTYDKDGNHIYIRNIKYINVDENSEIQPASGNTFSEYYKDERWIEADGEMHIISTVISHVAYKMWSTGYFSMEQVGDVFYASMGNTFNSDSNYLACRKFLIKTAEDKGYSAEQVDCIAHEFDLVGVYDESYEFKTDKFSKMEDIEDEDETIVTTDNSVDGDLILDNKTEKEFLVVYSVAGIVLGEGEGIYIYEVGDNLSDKEMKDISKNLSDKINSMYGDINVRGCDIKVEYKQIPKFAMKIAKKFCVDSSDYMRSMTLDGMGLTGEDADQDSVGMIEQVLKFAFEFKVIKSTPYELFDGLGLLE